MLLIHVLCIIHRICGIHAMMIDPLRIQTSSSELAESAENPSIQQRLLTHQYLDKVLIFNEQMNYRKLEETTLFIFPNVYAKTESIHPKDTNLIHTLKQEWGNLFQSYEDGDKMISLLFDPHYFYSKVNVFEYIQDQNKLCDNCMQVIFSLGESNLELVYLIKKLIESLCNAPDLIDAIVLHESDQGHSTRKQSLTNIEIMLNRKLNVTNTMFDKDKPRIKMSDYQKIIIYENGGESVWSHTPAMYHKLPNVERIVSKHVFNPWRYDMVYAARSKETNGHSPESETQAITPGDVTITSQNSPQ